MTGHPPYYHDSKAIEHDKPQNDNPPCRNVLISNTIDGYNVHKIRVRTVDQQGVVITSPRLVYW